MRGGKMNNNCKRREGFKKRGGGSDKRKMEETDEKYIETKTGRVETILIGCK